MSDPIPPPHAPQAPEEPPSATILPAQPLRRRFPAAKVVAIGASVALAAAGATVAVMQALSREAPLETLVPSDTSVFLKVALSPSADQLGAIEKILDHLPQASRDRLVPQIEDALDQIFTEAGLSYRGDVKPWVGAQAALAVKLDQQALVAEPPVVALLTVEDEAAAITALDKAAKSSGQIAFEVAKGVAYVSNSRGNIDELRAGAATAPLSENSSYKKAIDRVGEDGLFHLWFDTSGIDPSMFGVLPFAGLQPGAQYQANGALALRAEQDGIVLVGHASASGGPENRAGVPALLQSTSSGLLGSISLVDVPNLVLQFADAVEVFLAPESATFTDSPPEAPPDPLDEFGRMLGLDVRNDLFALMHGEFSVIFGGLDELGPQFGALIEVTDEAAADRTVAALARNLRGLLAQEDRGASVESNPQGLDVSVGELAIALRRSQGRIAIGTPPDYAASLLVVSPEALGDDRVYRQVVGSDSDATTSQMFLRIDRLKTVLESFLPPEERASYERDVAPYLGLFKAVGLRSTQSGDTSEFRMHISLN